MGSSTGGAGGKKIGRGLRKPAHKRYTNEGRYEKNKKRKQAKQTLKELKDKIKREQRKKDKEKKGEEIVEDK